MLELLRRRSFALLWTGGLVSVAGDWVVKAALPFFVYEETGSTIATAGMIVASLLPGALAGSPAGVFADRWNRQWLLVATSLANAAVVLALLGTALGGSLGLVYVVAALQSLLAAAALPAEAALVAALVEPHNLVAGNALNTLNNRLGRLVGAPVGGALYAAGGLVPVIAADCATFLVAALLLSRMTVPANGLEPTRETDAVGTCAAIRHEWLDGIRVVRDDRQVGLLFVILGLMTFGGTMLDPLTVAWVRDVLGEGADVFAWLIAAHAATGIVGTLVVGRFGGRVGTHVLVGVTSLVAACATAVKYNIPTVPLALATTCIQGVTSVASSVGVETLAMQTVPRRVQGRVFGSLNATLMLLSLVGALSAGFLGEVVGIVPVLNAAAILIGVAGIVVLRGTGAGDAPPD